MDSMLLLSPGAQLVQPQLPAPRLFLLLCLLTGKLPTQIYCLLARSLTAHALSPCVRVHGLLQCSSSMPNCVTCLAGDVCTMCRGEKTVSISTWQGE